LCRSFSGPFSLNNVYPETASFGPGKCFHFFVIRPKRTSPQNRCHFWSCKIGQSLAGNENLPFRRGHKIKKPQEQILWHKSGRCLMVFQSERKSFPKRRPSIRRFRRLTQTIPIDYIAVFAVRFKTNKDKYF